jgi:methionyl-tRNA formyltransferase
MQPEADLKVCLLAVGTKGANLVEDLAAHARIARVITYEPWGTHEPGVEALRARALDVGAELHVQERPDRSSLEGFDCIFTVGWQRLVDHDGLPLVVLHDSLLPRYRGFAPTVTALIEGEPCLGVSAILPTAEADAGPILAQSSCGVVHPIRVADAFEALRSCYVEVAQEVLRRLAAGPLVGQEQDHTRATASIWRDAEDLHLDWAEDAERLQRTVYALSAPYPGARTTIEGRTVIIRDAVPVEDVTFAVRQPGKVWRHDPDGPVVVCGRGLLRLTDVVEEDGTPVSLRRLRTRLGALR